MYIIIKEQNDQLVLIPNMHVFNSVHKGIFPVYNRQYSHDSMLQLRYCPAACVRPADLELIPGVTDKTPGDRFTPAALESTLSLVLTLIYTEIQLMHYSIDLRTNGATNVQSLLQTY